MRVRDALLANGYTPAGVEAALGHAAAAAIARDRYEPARRGLAKRDDGLALLISMLLLGDRVPASRARSAGLAAADLATAGLVAEAGGELVPLLRVEPLEIDGVPAWVVADFRRERPLPADHVLGLGGASATLSGITIPEQVGSALDLGTGGGVQLLHLAAHADRVVGTDVSERALELARLTLTLNEIEAQLVRGDRFEPVSGEQFDLIVSNPPMVIGPRSRFTYRDAGLEGDAMTASVIAGCGEHLTLGGRCQMLGHWMHREGQDWRERVSAWLPAQAHVLVLQREVLDPIAYVEMWLADSGDPGSADHAAHYDEWLAWFEDQRVTGVGMGWVSVQRTDCERPTITLEEAFQPVRQPVGDAIGARLAAWEWSGQRKDPELLDEVLAIAPGVVLDQRAQASDGWRPGKPVLVQTLGLAQSAPLDEFGALAVGRFDGRRPVREVLTDTAQDLGYDVEPVLDGAIGAVRALVEVGFLVPSGPGRAAPEQALV